MDSFTLSTTANSTSLSSIQFFSQPVYHAKKSGILNFPGRKPKKFWVSASRDEPQLDDWDRMELKFGRMIGEDPKITLAKIMGRKSNPDVSYLEIEKLLDKKKGRALDEGVEEIPFDLPGQKKSVKSVQGLNLVRPVLKKGSKFEETAKPVETSAKSPISRPMKKAPEETKSSVPDVILRKPRSFNEDDGASGSTRFGMRPNLSLRMGNEPQKERFSDITLLRKPAPLTSGSEVGEEDSRPNSLDSKIGLEENSSTDGSSSAPLLKKPELMKLNSNAGANHDSPNEHTELSSNDVMTENRTDVSNSENRQATTNTVNQNWFHETNQDESASDEGLGKGNFISL